MHQGRCVAREPVSPPVLPAKRAVLLVVSTSPTTATTVALVEQPVLVDKSATPANVNVPQDNSSVTASVSTPIQIAQTVERVERPVLPDSSVLVEVANSPVRLD